MRILLPLIFIASASLADDFASLSGDVALSDDELLALTSDQTLHFYEGGLSRYSTGGAYSYSYADGATAYGRFDVRADGLVCVEFVNGRNRCDRFVHSHGRLVLLTEDGDRFPVRP